MLRVVGQQCCVHLHGKDMLGIVVQQFCFRVHGSYTREHHSHSLQKKKKKRHKPSGEVRRVYDVILYGCAVILFSSGRHVSKNCKIIMTRKSLLSDFSRMKKHQKRSIARHISPDKFQKRMMLTQPYIYSVFSSPSLYKLKLKR